MKKFLWLGLLVLAPTAVFAGPDGRVSADPVYEDGGNDADAITISYSSSSWVLISSKATDVSLDGNNLSIWRHRQIINTSNGRMMVSDSNTQFNAFCGTCGVVLGTGPIAGLGDNYTVPHQGKVYGLWAPETTNGGAGGEQTYWNPTRR